MAFEATTAGLLFIVATVLLPIVVALVTKATTLGRYKAIVLLALTSVSSVVYQAYEAANTSADFDWKTVVLNAVVGFVVATALHFGLWKPANVTGSESKTAQILVKDSH